MGNYTKFRCSRILGEVGKQEILQKMFRKFWISNRLPNRYFPKIDVGCPCYTGSIRLIAMLLGSKYAKIKFKYLCPKRILQDYR